MPTSSVALSTTQQFFPQQEPARFYRHLTKLYSVEATIGDSLSTEQTKVISLLYNRLPRRTRHWRVTLAFTIDLRSDNPIRKACGVKPNLAFGTDNAEGFVLVAHFVRLPRGRPLTGASNVTKNSTIDAFITFANASNVVTVGLRRPFSI